MFERIEKDFSITPEEKEVIGIAELYAEFPAIRNVYRKFVAVLEKGEHHPEFVKEMEKSLSSLSGAVTTLQLSLKNQKKYALVDKRWIRDPDFMHSAFSRGRLTIELDIRMDAEGGFWVSHAVGARKTLMPPFIHKMTTAEMKEGSRRFSLQESLNVFSQYKANGHRLILELKTLGKEVDGFDDALKNLHQILKDNDVEDSVSVSSLSPGILMATHRVIPEMPLIFNGALFPGVSYPRSGGKIVNALVPEDKKWRAFSLNPFGDVVITAGDTIPQRPDGEGTQTGYVMARLPERLIEILQRQKKDSIPMGGMVSLAAVTMYTSLLDVIGCSKKAQETRKYYSDIVDHLGIGKMATTWGQNLSKLPGLSKLDPQKQMKVFKQELGVDTMVYTKSPEEWAHMLPEEVSDFVKKV